MNCLVNFHAGDFLTFDVAYKQVVSAPLNHLIY